MAFLSSIFTSIFSVTSNPSFVSSFITTLKFIGQWLLNAFLWIYDLVLKILWAVVRFVLGAMDILEYIIKSFIGVGVGPADLIDQAKDMQFMDILISVFRAIFAVAIVLLIVFTIYAIIKQEFRNAQNGFEGSNGSVGNDKKGILMRLFKSIMGMILLPLCMIFILVGVSAALTSFNNALKGPVDSTIASRVLASSTFDANRYRKYANANKRVPIVIEAYDAKSFGADQGEELKYRIKTGKVQNILINTATMMAENTCLPFADTLTYKNNKLTNSSNYGSYYESFVCTAEQYQVMADFVDYAELTGLTYYIKAMDEKDIDWKYVDSANYDSTQKSLTIKYHDANDINKNNSTSDTYEITYKMSYNVTSPISNALDSIMAMLGVGEFGDNLYKVMERDEDYLNVVKWSTEKVLIKFSDDFDATNPKTWTTTDQIIIYEFYHFSSNNTFSKYSLSDLKRGVELDALEITYRDYYAEAGAYSPERTITGVLINGSYYNTVKSSKLRDSYGNFYYILKTIDDVRFLNTAYTTINEIPDAKVQLSLSRGFDINDPTNWTYTDQILVYEFYNSSSYNNTLRRDPNKGIDIGFSAYMVDDAGNGGIKFPVYKITNANINTDVKNEANYVLLNGTFYSVREQSGEYFLNSGKGNFLTEANSDAYIVYQYNFNFDGIDNKVTGIDGGAKSSDTFIYEATVDSNEEELSDTEIEKYSKFSLKLSTNFDYKNTATWTYLDYFIFYLYSKYPGIANSVEELKYSALGGLLVKVRGSTLHLSSGSTEYLSGKIMYLIEYDNGISVKRVYLDVDEVQKISRLLMPTEIDHLATQNQNYFGVADNSLFINYELGGNLYNAETEYRNFSFSESFSESLPSTWTVEDLILVMLVRKNYLPSVREIQSAGGYNSLVYKIKDGANQTKYYKFSKERSTTGDTVIYLNERSVLNMVFADSNLQPITFDNIDEWLGFSALEFVAKIYSASASDFITNFNGIADSLYSEISSSVLSIGQIIEKLVNENGFIVGIGNTFEIYDEVSKYTYMNQTFNADDISTWTTIDAAIYYITGKTVGRYTSYVIRKDNKNYFVVGNMALDISSTNSKFRSSMKENNIITSTKSTLSLGGSSSDDIKNYVETNCSDLIFRTEDFLETNGDSRLSFYTNSEFNYSNTENHNNTYVYDVLEAILKVYENFSGTSKTFRVYTDGTDMFIGSTDKDGKSYFISVGAVGTMSAIKFIEQPTLTLNLSDENKIVFSTNGIYNAFENFDKDNPTGSSYSYLDSLIFNLTKNSDKKSYNIYSAGSRNYIDVDGTFIEYKLTDASITTIDVANSTYATGDYEYYLYSNFYSNFDLEPGTLSEDIVSDISYSSSFSIGDISTWSPANILLYELGVIKADGTIFTITGDYVESANGRDHYFRILDSATNNYLYILVEGILEFSKDDKELIVSTNASISEMYLNLFLAKDKNEDGEFTNQSSYISTNYLTFKPNLENVLNIINLVKQKSELSSNVLEASATAATSEKWSWFDLVYYKLFGTFRTEEDFEIYTNAYGATFIRLDISSTVHKFVKINNILTLTPDNSSIRATATGKESYNFNLSSSSFKNLDIIAYNLTGNTSGEVSYIRLPKTSTTFIDKIYFIQSSTGTYYAVCDLDNSSLTSGVSTSQIKYNTADGDDILSWNALDFLFKYVEGSPEAKEENSRVYTYGDSQFLRVGSLYLNISKLGLVYKSDRNILLIKDTDETTNKMPKILNNLFETFAAGSSRVPSLEAAEVTSSVKQKVEFSDGFIVDDINTWTLADFVIYYYFKEGLIRDDVGNVITNFQEIVNNGGANAYIKCYVFTDTYGNSKIYDVIKFGDDSEPKTGFNLVNYEVFKGLYGRKLIHYTNTITLNNVNISLNLSTRNEKPTTQSTTSYFTYSIKADLMSNSFAYSNFYFFKLDTSVAVKSDLINVPSNIIDTIVSGNDAVLTNGTVNLKLSDGFNISDLSTWTVLDFVIIREASRSVNGNIFKGKNLESLKSNINRVDVLELNNQKYLYLNGAVYNITNYIKSEDGDFVTDENNDFVFEAKINNSLNVLGDDGKMSVSANPIVSEGSVDDYDFRFMAKQINFLIIRETDEVVIKETDFKTPTTFSYVQKVDDVETNFYYTVDTRVSSNFEIDLSDTAKYPPDHLKISAIVRELNWPQKLMNDMFVIYPDLNWETLIATEGWIDTLGDFTSANASGNYITDENSANITAAGLVLSEFFLSVAKQQNYSYANYEYNPIFDTEVIQALMLALAGEENYKTLVDQAKIFNDMFNVAFASVLDDIAAETGIQIVDGKVDNFTMSVYKSYLTTLMLSSDFGEYIYKLATRVYAEYTIYESLAYAGGDYAKYYAFVNDLVDENGKKVTSFTYGSFYDLVVYENSVLGNGSATFTFNYRRVYRALVDKNATDEEIRASLENRSPKGINYATVFNLLDSRYSSVYSNGGTAKIGESDDLYCFMLDVYWSTVQRLFNQGTTNVKKLPDYISIYKSYIDGTMSRWNIIESVDATASATDLQYYKVYEAELVLKSLSLVSSIATLYIPTISSEFKGTDEELESLDSSFKNTEIDLNMPYHVLKKTFEGSSYYSSLLDDVLSANPIELIKMVIDSPKGKSNSWDRILDIYDKLRELLAEIGSVCAMGSGMTNKNGSKKDPEILDKTYQKTYSALNKVTETFESYVSTQKKIDSMKKTSITFMLKQFGDNFQTEGFAFSLENRKYTLTTTTSPRRLAEYVYGGAFLEKFGVEPVYTDKGSAGIVESLIKYDHYDGMIKTKLSTFKVLREFVSSLADYTAKLYYISNFNDLALNTNDSTLMTDYVYANSPFDEKIQFVTTPEFLIISHLAQNSDIDADTLIRLVFGDTVRNLENLSTEGKDFLNDETYNSFVQIIKALDGQSSLSDISDKKKRDAIVYYLDFIMSDDYNSFGYYNYGGRSTPAERIHSVFKNVITYLITTEDSSETSNENAVNLDGLNFKEFRLILMQKLVEYKQNQNETSAENASRYLALFDLISSQFTYYKYSGSGANDFSKRIGRTISFEHLSYKELDDGKAVPMFDETNYLFATFNIDTASRNMVLSLAGIPNRPIEELINLEYNSLYEKNGDYDEANGDTFIVCTYDDITGMYVPILARNTNGGSFETNSAYANYIRDYHINPTTSYYNQEYGRAVAQPIVAKGVLTADLKPTAIKMEDYVVKFYRTDISATANLDDDALSTMRVTQETQVIGFTRFVNRATSKLFSGENSQTMFIGQSNITSFLNSDFSVYFVQITNAYNCTVNGQNAFNVLDTFSYFFAMSWLEYMLLALGFATVIPLLFKASIAAMQRILDIILLTLMGPVAISANSLNLEDSNQKDNTLFEKWRNYMTQSILQAFGLVVGFNMYYILMSTITGMTFVSAFTVEKIHALGGMTFVSANMLNAVVKFLFIVTAASIVKAAGNLITRIITLGKVSDAFSSPISGDGFSNVKDVLKTMKNSFNTAKAAITGELLLEAKDAAIQELKEAIPGYQLAAKAASAGRSIAEKARNHAIQKALESKGVPKSVAKKMVKEFSQETKKQRYLKEKRRVENANKFVDHLDIEDDAKKEIKFKDPKAPKESKNTQKGKVKKKKQANASNKSSRENEPDEMNSNGEHSKEEKENKNSDSNMETKNGNSRKASESSEKNGSEEVGKKDGESEKENQGQKNGEEEQPYNSNDYSERRQEEMRKAEEVAAKLAEQDKKLQESDEAKAAANPVLFAITHPKKAKKLWKEMQEDTDPRKNKMGSGSDKESRPEKNSPKKDDKNNNKND